MIDLLTIGLAQTTLRMTVPLLLAALGGLAAERAGIINLGLEGMMLGGAFGAVLGSYYTGSPWVGLIMAMVAGGALGLLHGLFCIRWRADQVLSGLSITVISVSLCSFLLQVLFKQGGNTPAVPKLPEVTLPLVAQVPVLGPLLSGHSLLFYIALVLPFAGHLLLHRTPWGIWLKATGEHPRAVQTFGINVFQVRYAAVAISGMLAGLGGAYLSIAQMGFFSQNISAGRGFIAVAAVIFGRWQPLGVLAATLTFALFDGLQLTMQFATREVVPKELLQALPYVVTLLMLAGAAGRAAGPAAAGQPFDPEGR